MSCSSTTPSAAFTALNSNGSLCPLAEFLQKVPRLRLLDGSVPPLHVSDGESAQDATLQLHQRGPGLCGSASRTHTAGISEKNHLIQRELLPLTTEHCISSAILLVPIKIYFEIKSKQNLNLCG